MRSRIRRWVVIGAACLAIAATWFGTAGNDVSHVLGSSHKAVHIDLETVELPEQPSSCELWEQARREKGLSVLGCLELY